METGHKTEFRKLFNGSKAMKKTYEVIYQDNKYIARKIKGKWQYRDWYGKLKSFPIQSDVKVLKCLTVDKKALDKT